MQILKRIAILITILLLAACGSDSTSVASTGEPSTADSGDGAAASLNGEFWSTSVTVDGAPRPLVEGTQIRLSFDGDQIGASAGCNSMGGSFTLTDAGALEVSDLFMTEMGCDGPLNEQDSFVAAFLTDSPTIRVGEDAITLSTASTTIELVDSSIANPDRPLIDTGWEVTGFFDRSVATSFNVDEPARVRFFDDSTMTGFDGCADFAMPVEISDGSIGGAIAEGVDGELQFGRIIDTPPDACEHLDYATKVGGILRGRATYTIDGKNLTIHATNGDAITLVAIDAR